MIYLKPLIILSLCVLLVHTKSIPNKEKEDVALEAATFVLDSLKDINDSGIYEESLHLIAVHNISILDGLYHTNTIMTVELESPHFEDATELFDVIVMESKQLEQGREEDVRRRGYAIDRFPEMKDDEVEASLQRKIDRTVKRNKDIRKRILSW